MSDLIKYLDVDDLETSIARATKIALMDLPEFKVDKPSFTAKTDAKNRLIFPTVGVDFRTVSPSGYSGNFHPEVLTPNGIVGRLLFDSAQPSDITIPAYQSFSTYFVGTVEDLPFELFTWAGDASATEKQTREIPIGIPVISSTSVVRTSGRGEYIRISGYFTVYAGARQGGNVKVKAETAKLYHAIRNHPDKFTEQGLTQMLIDPAEYSTFTKDAVLYEGAIKFSCVARIF